jgi:signal transduction histidine kinase
MGVVGRRTVALTVCASTVITLLVIAWPRIGFASRGRELHVALETTGALVALLAGVLMLGRFERRRRLDDVLLAWGLVVFGLVDLGFLAVPAIAGGAGDRVAVWTALVGRTTGAVALALAAAGLPRRVRRWHASVFALLAALAVIAAAAGAVVLAGSHLPRPVHELTGHEDSGGARLAAHPAALAAQLVTMALFAAAAVGLERRSDREGDAFLGWLAIGCVLAAFARLHYFLYPSLYSDWVYTGDLFRLLFHATVLTGAALEVRRYWRSQVHVAVLDERRRMARDLHDGLAQELAYIKRNLQWLDERDGVVARLREASDRALIESRRAVAALTASVDRPLPTVLREAVDDVATRERIRAIVDVDDDVDTTAEEGEALLRIACEAVTNAARHGHSELVRVELKAGNPVRMRISDAGVGFDPGAAAVPGHFGVTSMRERASALGGRLTVASAPGRGTDVEVEL